MARKLSALFLMALTLLAAVVGCSKAGATSQPASSMPALTGYSLADTSWVLVSYGDPAALNHVITGTTLTLKFNSDTTQISGTGGVNGFGGDCIRQDDQITFSRIIHTEIASTNPLINAQENVFFQMLIGAQNVDVGGGTLTINCAGAQVLNFVSA